MTQQSPKSTVIFVHGTGAGDLADRGQRWWQIGSLFEQTFSAAIFSSAFVDRPFHWSGRNSESERRVAGLALLQRLLALEGAGQSYHLVGHSHGGSVIWNALIASVRAGQHLKGLKSWTTVGTPYLTFGAVRAGIWRWTALVTLAGLAAWLFHPIQANETLSIIRQLWREQTYSQLAFIAFFFTIFAALLLWALGRVLLPLAFLGFEMQERRDAHIAAMRYGEGWLSLWHPLDEPINSLAGTVGEAPQITPRVAQDGIWGIIPFAGTVINSVLARAADQFAWKQVSDRAQGNDRRHFILLSVGRAPPALQPGFGPIPPTLAAEIATSSDNKSVDSVRRLRNLLESAYDQQGTEAVLERVATVISFQEIIHTSYFDHPAIAEVVAQAVLRQSLNQRDATDSLPTGDTPVRIKSEALSSRFAVARRQALEVVMACSLFIAPGLVLALGARAAYDSVIAPETANFQIDQIAKSLLDAGNLATGNDKAIAEVALRLHALDRLPDPVSLLDNIPQGASRRSAAYRLAYAYGGSAQIEQIDRLLRQSEPTAIYPYYADAVRVFAYTAYVDQQHTRPDNSFAKLADDFLSGFQAKAAGSDYNRIELARILLSRLELAGRSDRRDQLLEFVTANIRTGGYNAETLCSYIRTLALQKARIDPSQDISSLINRCQLTDRRTSIVDAIKRDLFDRGSTAALAAFMTASGKTFMNVDEIAEHIRIADEANRQGGLLPSNPFLSVAPDILALEKEFNEALEDDLRDSANWPRRLGWEYSSNYIALIERLHEAGAKRIAAVLLEVAEDQVENVTMDQLKAWQPEFAQKMFEKSMEESSRFIQVAALLARPDLAKRVLDQTVSLLQQIEKGDVSKRIVGLAAVAVGASAVNDKAAILWAANQVLLISIRDINFMSASTMLDFAEKLHTIDSDVARQLLQQAERMTDILSDQRARLSMYSTIAGMWAQAGDLKKGVAAARKAGAGAAQMKAYTAILDEVLEIRPAPIAKSLGVGKSLTIEDSIANLISPLSPTE